MSSVRLARGLKVGDRFWWCDRHVQVMRLPQEEGRGMVIDVHVPEMGRKLLRYGWDEYVTTRLEGVRD